MALFSKLSRALARTRAVFRSFGADQSDLEAALLAADVGVKATQRLLGRLRPGADRQKVLAAEIAQILSQAGPVGPVRPVSPPLVVMVVGVNGSGKTTTVGKLGRFFADQGKRVVVACADTYRDAAAQQLAVWAGRADGAIVLSQPGQDAAAVAFDAIRKAILQGIDVVLIDTAGRLHTRRDLMAEVEKIKRVCAKAKPGAPDEIWLVLDATVGQNGIKQAQAFHAALELTGIIVTKLDGTAKGGVLIPIALELGLPIRFVGTGEGIGDLEVFDPAGYTRALFEESP